MPCSYWQRQLNELDRAMGTMRRAGIPSSASPFSKLSGLRGQVYQKIGLKLPRVVTQLMRLIALSPGEIILWHDVEAGFVTEARTKPGAPPIYHWPTDDQAMALLTGNLTKELELELMRPVDYFGE